MATKRLTVRNIREILRLGLGAKLTLRQIHSSTKSSVGAVQKVLAKAKAIQLRWPLPAELDDSALEKLFYPKNESPQNIKCPSTNWAEIHLELKKKGITKQLLWEEHVQQNQDCYYSYSRFCHHYSVWKKKQQRSMRQVHKAGEKLFVDYAGQTIPIVCASTGEVRTAQIFVAVLGASNYTYVEATHTQSLPDW
ncbi:transposase, partial [Parashewanella curva]